MTKSTAIQVLVGTFSSVVLASASRATPQDLPLKFTSPPPQSFFNSGQTVDLRWKADVPLKDPVFRVCLRKRSPIKTQGLAKRKSKHHEDEEQDRGQDYGESSQFTSGSDDLDDKYDGESALSQDQSYSSWDDEDRSSSNIKDEPLLSGGEEADDRMRLTSGHSSTKEDGNRHDGHAEGKLFSHTPNDEDEDQSSDPERKHMISNHREDKDQVSDLKGHHLSSQEAAANGSISPGSDKEYSGSVFAPNEDSASSSSIQSDTPLSIKPSSKSTASSGLCGTAMFPCIQQEGEEYVVSLLVPDDIPAFAAQLYILIDDHSGSKARSPTFLLGSAKSVDGITSTLGSVPDTREQGAAQQPFNQGGTFGHGIGITTSLPSSFSSNSSTSVSPPDTLVASHSPPPPTAALAAPLSLVGGVLLVAVFLAFKEYKNRREDRAPRPQLASVYCSKPDIFMNCDQQEVPVPLFMPNSHASQQQLNYGLRLEPERRITTRDLPMELSSSVSEYSSISRGLVFDREIPQSLVPAHVRGKPTCNKQLPSIPPTGREGFEEIRLDDEVGKATL